MTSVLRRKRANRFLALVPLLATSALCSGLVAPAFGQTAESIPPPPVRRAIDDNGVDVIRGTFNLSQTDVSIGANAKQGLVFRRFGIDGRWSNDFIATLDQSGSIITATVNGSSDSFSVSGSTYTPTEANGATLELLGGYYRYTSRDRVVVNFQSNAGGLYDYYRASLGRVSDITYPDGARVNFTYKEQLYCGSGWENGSCPAATKVASRLQSVTNSNGYQLKFAYADNGTELSIANYAAWADTLSVKAINNAVEYCDPSADSCALTNAWPTATYTVATDVNSNQTRTVTDALGRTTRYIKSGVGSSFKVKRPGADADNVVVSYGAGGVSNITSNGVTYGYGYVDVGAIRTTTVTDANAKTRVYVGNTTTFLLSSYRDELNRLTSYIYDASGRTTEVTYPEGNKTQYTYDARGNVTQTRAISKTPGTPPDIVTSASFPATCANTKICNKPISATDAKGNVTDFAYDATHGGVLTVTAPAPTSGGIRPQTRLSYGTSQAYYKNSGGSIVASGLPITLLTSSSMCQTTASCAGAADEVKTTINYGPQVAGTGNNLLPVSASSGSGNGVLTATKAATYDNIGNAVSVDGPLPGTADTTAVRYDAARQVVGVIGPDPDGAGTLKNRAQRMTYNLDGQVTKAEVGTTTGQTDPAWAAFVSLQEAQSTYDANARKTQDKVIAGGTTYSVGQYSYDALGRSDCAAQRMNPAAWATATPACTLQTAGTDGPDRINKAIYDAASRVTKVQTAVGTPEQSDEATSTYNANGTQATVADALGNLTTYEYDGFDRLLKTRYPTAGNGTVSSTTDYDGLTIDPNGNVTQRRLRDGTAITYTYDNLNRVTLKDLPGTAPYLNEDVTYTYDLLGRLKMTQDSDGFYNSFVYDALGRLVSDQTWAMTTTNAYDLAGRMTRLTYGDGFYVDYSRLVTGEVSAIRENGAASGIGVLGTYIYNDLGQLTSLTRGNGAVSSYLYDPVSRTSVISHNLAGTANDVTTDFTYNPASQIGTNARNNDSYAWNGHYNVDRPYSVNGLNQMTTSGAATLGYDGRGNLSSTSVTNNYTYSAENRLVTGSTGFYLTYEPGSDRILQLYTQTTDIRFAYAGSQMIAEMTAGNILKRYVYGPGADNPLVWYEGSGTTDRRWLISDERGSVIAVTNASGSSIATNRYDEYGIPASTNMGRFQYTGQAWIPELGMYYYKARIYSPTLGRFMQTDPIGYGAGMNIYNYVGSDPVNFTDPLGLARRDPDTRTLRVEQGDIIVQAQSVKDDPGAIANLFSLGKLINDTWSFTHNINNESNLGIQYASNNQSATATKGWKVLGNVWYYLGKGTITNGFPWTTLTLNLRSYNTVLIGTRFNNVQYGYGRGDTATSKGSYSIGFLENNNSWFAKTYGQKQITGSNFGYGTPMLSTFEVPEGANYIRFLPNELTGSAEIMLLGRDR